MFLARVTSIARFDAELLRSLKASEVLNKGSIERTSALDGTQQNGHSCRTYLSAPLRSVITKENTYSSRTPQAQCTPHAWIW